MGCGGSKADEPKFTDVDSLPKPDQGGKEPEGEDVPVTLADGRKVSQRKRRRVAVAAENSEMLASVRWQSAFDAIRKEEFKLPQHILKMKATLTSHAIFGGMEPEIIDKLVTAMRVNKVKAGEEVIKQGDPGDAFYIVGDGALVVDVDGKEVAQYKGGDMFGELALLYDAPRAATVKATADGLLFKLGRIHFRNLILTEMQKSKVGLEERLCKVRAPLQLPAAPFLSLSTPAAPTRAPARAFAPTLAAAPTLARARAPTSHHRRLLPPGAAVTSGRCQCSRRSIQIRSPISSRPWSRMLYTQIRRFATMLHHTASRPHGPRFLLRVSADRPRVLLSLVSAG